MNAQKKAQEPHLASRTKQVISRLKTLMAIERTIATGKNKTMPILKLNFADPGNGHTVVNHASHSSHTSHASHHSRHR